jgi:hypothetical protein
MLRFPLRIGTVMTSPGARRISCLLREFTSMLMVAVLASAVSVFGTGRDRET